MSDPTVAKNLMSDDKWIDVLQLRCGERKARIEALEAEVERLRHEMRRYLPVLEALEANPSSWEWFTDSTGIATLNGYRHALAALPTTPEQESKR